MCALVLAAGVLLAGCSQSQPTVQVQQNSNGSVTVTVLPPPGSNGQPQTVILPPGVVPPQVVNRLNKKPAPPPTPPKPGNGGTASPDPKQTPPKQPAPPASTVSNPTKPTAPTTTASSNTSDKSRIESDFGVSITGKDATNSEYLAMLRAALALYPPGTMNGLQVILDEESLDKTGGVGGVWQEQGTRKWVTIYQAGASYIHVTIHELGHQLDLGDNNGAITDQLISAAKVNGTIPASNIPSAYAKYGLENPDHNPEYGAEVISWSLDSRGVPGFASTPTWSPSHALMAVLGRYVDPAKLLYK